MEQDNDKIKCGQVTDDVLLEYIEGTLGDDLREKVYQHFGECPSCRVRAEEIRQIAGALRESPQLSEDIPVPASVDRAVFAAIRGASRAGKPGLSRTLHWLAPLAAGVLAIVVIVGLLTMTGQRAGYENAARHSEKHAPGGLTQREFDPQPDLPLTPPPVAVQPPAEEQPGPLRAAYESEVEKNRVLEETIAQNDKDMGELNAKITDLQAELAAEKAKPAFMAEALRKRDEDAKKLESALAELQRAFGGQSGKLTQAEETIRKLKENIAGLENQIGDLIARMDELGKKFRDAKASAAQTKAHLLQLERDKARLEKRVLVVGDVNGDRETDILDAMIIVNRLLAGYGVAYSREADANGDGRVDVGDALQILNKALVE